MSLSGHKFYAPKGVGLLYVKENTPIKPIFFGGEQESQLFSGTENVISVGALAEALKICCDDLYKNMEILNNLDTYFISLLNKNNIDYKINGINRVPGILNITIPNTHASSFIINLDKEGYAISAGSACASGSIKGSHTLKEIGLKDDDIDKSYRISFGKFHKKDDVEKSTTDEKAVITPHKKGTPVHVKAAWVYNDLLRYWGLNNFEQIKSSEKIKWIYLKPNTMNIKQIGFKGYDDPPKIMEFIKQNVDYDKLFTRALEKKIRMFYEALNWEMPVDKINTLERFF